MVRRLRERKTSVVYNDSSDSDKNVSSSSDESDYEDSPTVEDSEDDDYDDRASVVKSESDSGDSWTSETKARPGRHSQALKHEQKPESSSHTHGTATKPEPMSWEMLPVKGEPHATETDSDTPLAELGRRKKQDKPKLTRVRESATHSSLNGLSPNSIICTQSWSAFGITCARSGATGPNPSRAQHNPKVLLFRFYCSSWKVFTGCSDRSKAIGTAAC